MSNTYKINFKQLRQQALKETFASFDRACNVLSLEMYLIGALARDTWFAGKGIRALGTKDIDLAVLVPEEAVYNKLKAYLVAEEKFTETNNSYTLRDTNGYEVDLLPFGAIEIEGKKIKDAVGNTRYDVTGFSEVYEYATEEVEFENIHSFKVSSLAGIVILKLIAWEDRLELRGKDLTDIALVIKYYYELEEHLIFETHADLFETESDDLDLLGARALGREMGRVLNKNTHLKTRIERILSENQETLTQQLNAHIIGPGSPAPLDYQEQIINRIRKGIDEQTTHTDS